MRKIFLSVILTLGLLISVFVFAQIIYPVEELGNCQNEAECKIYCDEWENIEECISFAEVHDLISSEELVEAKKIAKALAGGAVPPGGCSSPTQCKAYCEEPTLIEECISFAEEAGIIPPSEAEEARMVRRALLAGIPLPGNCGTKKNCEAYCSEPAHMNECVQFVRRAGLISADEVIQIEKAIPLMAREESPGGCKSKEECEIYCADESHAEECVLFALELGLMTQEEAEVLRKTGGKSPGNCKSKITCDAFCNNPANQETCFEFAIEYDLIPQDEIQKMREGVECLKIGLEKGPSSEAVECLISAVGIKDFNKIKEGTFLPSPQIGEKIRICIEEYMSPSIEEPFPSGYIGPGGCITAEECEIYCSDPTHYEECLQFIEFENGK